MKLTYEEHPDYQFPHWITFSILQPHDNMMTIMDINQWAGEMFGELGVKWGYERIRELCPNMANQINQGANINPVRRSMNTSVIYYWRFKDKADAAAFKLRWDNL